MIRLVLCVALLLMPIMMWSQPQESSDLQIISALMEQQQQAWNSANIEGFMVPYWHSDSLQFTGSKGPKYGWQATLNNYKKSYPDAAAMGKLQFTNINILHLCDDYVYVFGKWELTRPEGKDAAGYYTLIWRKMNGQWVIISDHSS